MNGDRTEEADGRDALTRAITAAADWMEALIAPIVLVAWALWASSKLP
jgi:hypothetical protein